MEFPDDANGDVFRRMQRSKFDFSVLHNVEFFAVFRTEEAADAVAKLFLSEHKLGDRLVNIETRPAKRGGMELLLVKSMLLTHIAVSDFESKLADRVALHDGYIDGWGVLQDEA